MNKFHLVTIFAMVTTISIASHLFVLGALGPTTPGFLATMGLRVRRLVGAGGTLLNDWVAAMLARRERQAAAWRAARERLR